jgi:hypothetical protein
LGPGLKTLWQDLDELQQAAVAEALYLTGAVATRQEQFKAKYGALPQWHDRSSMYSYNRPAAKLDLFFYPTGNYRAWRSVARGSAAQAQSLCPRA